MDNLKQINIFSDATFHHVGLAVPFIDEDINSIYDPIQDVTVAFININGIRVEFVKPESINSPAKNFVGKGIYHLCFQVKNMLKSIKEAEKNGFKIITIPVSAKAFNNRKIVWIISSKYGLIELMQK